MAVHHISDINNPHLAPYQQVRDRDALGPDGRPGLFIGESAVVIGAMLRAGVDVLSILTSDRHAERAVAMVDEARGFRSHMPDPQVLLVADDILDATVGSTFTADFWRSVGDQLNVPFVRLFLRMGKTRCFLWWKRSTTSTTSASCFETQRRLVVTP